MSDSEGLPKELYYLESDFSVRSLRKYQIKDILLAHGIQLSANATKLDYIMRFNQDIEPRREEIIGEHKQLLKTRELSAEKEEYGRGHRTQMKHQRQEKSPATRRKRNGAKNTNESLPKKDKDGFTIPQSKTRKRSIRKSRLGPPEFTTQDSFTSDDDPIASSSKSTHLLNDDEDDDGDFIPHNYEGSDDEDELGEIEKDELVELYKDQNRSPESFTRPKYHMMTRAQKADCLKEQSQKWRRRFVCLGYGLGMICFSIMFAGFCITGYARNKNGYCQNFPQPLMKTNATQFLHLPPSCIPCPDHGICSKGQLTCDALHERKTPFYNLRGLFPTADECIHNSVLGKYVSRVERRIKDQLARHQGENVCEYLIDHPEMDMDDALPIARLKVKDVLHQLKIDVQNTLPKDKADEIMMIALTSVLEDPKIHYTEVDGERYFGTENIKFSLSCHIARLYYAASPKMKKSILSALATIILLTCLFNEYKGRKEYRNYINRLTKLVLDKLKEKSDIHKQMLDTLPTISVTDLRSAIVDINNPSTLKDWKNVLEQIELNPHVRKSFKEERGEPAEYWELTT
ncbi:hypothetical protein K501DRAFT_335642 [Backusella circina FSU 941]|nr:hypothetical protein K501DRAFT_335642 [Backusella circina FSU 941]